MIMRTTCTLAVLALFGSAGAEARAALGVGDVAPPLRISEWIQGEAVNLKRDIGKNIYMVEFWAVWCPPCKMSVPKLTQIQNKFKDHLVIIGVTAPDFRGNTPAAIRRFVKQQGRNMSYTVAIDRDMATTDAYMTAAEVMGIPHAFLIDRKGKIAWQGSPLDDSLEDVVRRLVSGTFDAKAEAEAEELLQRLVVPAVQASQWQRVWDGLLAVLQVDPGNMIGVNFLLQIHIDHLQDREAYRSWCKAHIAKHAGDARAMLRLATALCNNQDLAFRTPALTLEAARAAYEATNRRSVKGIEIHARAQYQIGKLDRAIELQQEAVNVAGDAGRPRAQAIVEYYTQCKELRARSE